MRFCGLWLSVMWVMLLCQPVYAEEVYLLDEVLNGVLEEVLEGEVFQREPISFKELFAQSNAAENTSVAQTELLASSLLASGLSSPVLLKSMSVHRGVLRGVLRKHQKLFLLSSAALMWLFRHKSEAIFVDGSVYFSVVDEGKGFVSTGSQQDMELSSHQHSPKPHKPMFFGNQQQQTETQKEDTVHGGEHLWSLLYQHFLASQVTSDSERSLFEEDFENREGVLRAKRHADIRGYSFDVFYKIIEEMSALRFREPKILSLTQTTQDELALAIHNLLVDARLFWRLAGFERFGSSDKIELMDLWMHAALASAAFVQGDEAVAAGKPDLFEEFSKKALLIAFHQLRSRAYDALFDRSSLSPQTTVGPFESIEDLMEAKQIADHKETTYRVFYTHPRQLQDRLLLGSSPEDREDFSMDLRSLMEQVRGVVIHRALKSHESSMNALQAHKKSYAPGTQVVRAVNSLKDLEAAMAAAKQSNSPYRIVFKDLQQMQTYLFDNLLKYDFRGEADSTKVHPHWLKYAEVAAKGKGKKNGDAFAVFLLLLMFTR